MLRFLQNTGDYFNTGYFTEDFAKKVIDKSGYDKEAVTGFIRQLTPLKDKYFRYKQHLLEDRLRPKDIIGATHSFHTSVLDALGYEESHRAYDPLFHLTETEVLPVRQVYYRGQQLHLAVLEMQPLIALNTDEEPPGLFEQRYSTGTESEFETAATSAQRYHRSQWQEVFTVPGNLSICPSIINEAISTLFLLEQNRRPAYVLLMAGNVLFLMEAEKWFRGAYLQLNLEELFAESAQNRNYFALLYLLVGKEALAPQSNRVLMEQLDEDSHKSAYEVTKDLKEGVIHAVEALANEALYYRKQVLGQQFDETDDRFEQEVKDDCLTIVYRLLFLFYAESRPDLDILPSSDEVYSRGYSLEMLRDLEQVPLNSEHSRNGYFFHESLEQLFGLLLTGYREAQDGTANRSFRVRHLDSPLFQNGRLKQLKDVKFRNRVWQDIICQLSLSRQQRHRARGRISYANLGINQLGSVYESLLAFRGFYAEQDYIEVHKPSKPEDGTWLVPRERRADFTEAEIVKDENDEDIILPKGAFVYRLSGRDRQNSASYYTPEVLTRCTVKYTLKPLLEKLEAESGGKPWAHRLLELKMLEPAVGAAAFINEMINQLAEAYLGRRQEETRKRVSPDAWREEVQKVKAFIATHNVYGVDLNPTAIELGRLSLWLNVIHKDMETPFFANRLTVGNAVVGAWLKTYSVSAFSEEWITEGGRRVVVKKEWWEIAPNPVKWQPGKGFRRRGAQVGVDGQPTDGEVYHFLLPDKNMVASASIRLLKEEWGLETKRVSDWRKEWTKPLKTSEVQQVQRISHKIDHLLHRLYRSLRQLYLKTGNRVAVWGAMQAITQTELPLNYDAKEELAEQRLGKDAPYFKLKLIMDYWCALWFWDVRQAADLPARHQYWDDIEALLNIDEAALVLKKKGSGVKGRQQRMFDTATQLTMAMESSNEEEEDYDYEEEEPEATPAQSSSSSTLTHSLGTKETDAERPPINILGIANETAVSITEALVENLESGGLYRQENKRLAFVSQLAQRYRFHHPQLEFLDVFWERGGFDLVAGNPPWLKIQFKEKEVIAERFPEVVIQNIPAPRVRQMQNSFFSNVDLKELYLGEAIGTEAAATFMNAKQNYPLLVGQQTNLYKCVLENGFSLLSKEGFMGLLHPEGIYDDPNGQPLRREVYQKLRYHFQFQNAFNLFSEVAHRERYGVHIYAGLNNQPSFYSINNLFHPSTVDGCFVHDGLGTCGGIKVKGEGEDGFVWNISSHRQRIVHFDTSRLRVLAKTFETGVIADSAKLVSIHSEPIISVLDKLSNFTSSVNNTTTKVSEGWHETNDVDTGNILRNTVTPNMDEYEMVYSGPHFFVSNPAYKTPRVICTEKGHYDAIEHMESSNEFIARTNFVPGINPIDFAELIKGFKTGETHNGQAITSRWIDYYKLGFRKMLSQAGERTLACALLPPKSSHINGVISIIFKDEEKLLEAQSICSSIVLDFFIKTVGKSNLYDETIRNFPLGVANRFKTPLYSRTLLLNCLNKYYAPLWQRHYQPSFNQQTWSKADTRLKSFETLTTQWQWATPLRNWYERRQALVEIDVLSAMALRLTLSELILIYNVQFPVLQQNEDDTWYDALGHIVFTCSKGLTGVGVDRPVWEKIRHLSLGESYEHTITKSELYTGRTITYLAPFDKCDRVEDYRQAWVHFEKELAGNNRIPIANC